MTKWKAGDFAMVEIARSGDEHAVVLVGPRGHECLIRPEYLTPLPPTKTAAEAALVEASIKAMTDWKSGVIGSNIAMADVSKAAYAVLAERAPPDLLAKLRKVTNAATALLCSAGVKYTADDLEAVVSALEAERDGRKS